MISFGAVEIGSDKQKQKRQNKAAPKHILDLILSSGVERLDLIGLLKCVYSALLVAGFALVANIIELLCMFDSLERVAQIIVLLGINIGFLIVFFSGIITG